MEPSGTQSAIIVPACPEKRRCSGDPTPTYQPISWVRNNALYEREKGNQNHYEVGLRPRSGPCGEETYLALTVTSAVTEAKMSSYSVENGLEMDLHSQVIVSKQPTMKDQNIRQSVRAMGQTR